MTALAPGPRGVLHRPADDPAASQPAHRSPPTATPSSCCSATPEHDRQAPRASCTSADLDAAAISGFLQHLETGRGNSAATRNARLAAIHSLFRYAALHVPEHAALIARVLAIPAKRVTKPSGLFPDPGEPKPCWPRRTAYLARPP